MQILGFDWDDRNRGKLEAHDLEPDDIEWLFDRGEPVVLDHPVRTGRYLALGFVPDGRFIIVIFTYEGDTRWVRVVTAYEAEHERWWKIYRKATAG